jgi:ketosteroid isomerase-like protein
MASVDPAPTPTEVRDVVARLEAAMNAHDVDALVGCFDPRYESEQPIHPARRFTGSAQVRRNWTSIFAEVPDLHAERRALAVEGDTVLSEWRWHGRRADGSAYDKVGVIVMGIEGGRIRWARLYMEEVEGDAAPVREAVHDLARGAPH